MNRVIARKFSCVLPTLKGSLLTSRGSELPLRSSSPIGLHRVLEPVGVLPQAATRLDASSGIWPDEVRIAVEVLNLDAASYRQLAGAHPGADGGVDGAAVRAEVLEIIASRGKMQNPVTGSGGMLVGTVAEVGPESPLGLAVGDRVATLVSLSLTPLRITDGLTGWDGRSEQVPAAGDAILFGRSIAAVIPDDLDPRLSLMVMDVCGAPALVARVVRQYVATRGANSGPAPTVAVIGGAGKSGSLALAAARDAGAGRTVGIVPVEAERETLASAGLADAVALADARDPVALAAAVESALGGGADITVVCVDVPGCEHGAILATAEGGTVVFFSMATSFSAAALGAEGLAADVTMLVGNGYLPGHAAYALDLLRRTPAVRSLFERRLTRRGDSLTMSRTLLHNGHILTVPGGSPTVGALLIEDGRVVWSGRRRRHHRRGRDHRPGGRVRHPGLRRRAHPHDRDRPGAAGRRPDQRQLAGRGARPPRDRRSGRGRSARPRSWLGRASLARGSPADPRRVRPGELRRRGLPLPGRRALGRRLLRPCRRSPTP